ncbi:hypothetical protein HHK36_000216 [Tetracentron sinense]|uniref:Uncharacterized protein n=1 Tax=Tetracentron sinense TaxID=13715 RepID=A0A834ZRU0_TETSI|nr:hypothetical protein HHK36_000216 [Tetracentron sinense]
MLNRKPNKSMEETKLIQCTKTQTPKSPSTSQNLPPQAPPLLQNKKRKFDNVDIQNSNYFKILAVVKELRPYFIEVLRTPDYQNCKAAHEIQKRKLFKIHSGILLYLHTFNSRGKGL